MADSDAQAVGGIGPMSETDRQSHPIAAWGAMPSSGMWPQSVPDGSGGTNDLGSYVPINLPPNPGPRAADVVGERSPDVYGFPGIGGGARFPTVGRNGMGGGPSGMYG